MSDQPELAVGSVSWMDLTIENATEVRDFYSQVVGWDHVGADMGEYEDYCMNEPGSGKTVAGICHARGMNQGMPAQWMIYITVENVAASVAKVVELGGEVVREPQTGGMGTFAIIRDPAGAVAALYSPATS